MFVPAYVKRFRDVLLENKIETADIECGRKEIHGYRGILTTSKIWYNMEPKTYQLLGRELEYTFEIGHNQRFEISIQLFLNIADHWRLFADTKHGLLLSVNLSLLSKKAKQFTLCQTMKIAVHNMTKAERLSRQEALCRTLRNIGLDIDDNHRLILGTFDSKTGLFLDVSPKTFLRSFLTAALIKGHYMGNKGYSLSSLPKREPEQDIKHNIKGRSIPLGLRYRVLEQGRSKCAACGRGTESILHVDHIVPFSMGGKTELSNLQVLCSKCNLGKGNRSSRRLK